MDKIAIYMSAYNAEKTLPTAIESVLAQTYKNFDLYISENGSTDSTFDIIKSYCEKYEFILCYKHTQNFTGSFMSSLYGFMGKNNYNTVIYYKYDNEGEPVPVIRDCADWVCLIDSDDTIQPTYLEEMLNYAKENDLDMVTCGWDFVRSSRVDHRIPDRDEIIYKKDFAEKLPYYDKFMGPVWNKLFRYESMAKNITYYENKFSRLFRDGVYFYGADTAYNYLYLGNDLEKFGLIARQLYNYNISDESISRKHFHPMRIIADRRMAEVRFDFLQEIGAEITADNKEFIMNIYFKSIKATLDLLENDDRYDLKQKMKYMHKIFCYKLLNNEFIQNEEKYL